MKYAEARIVDKSEIPVIDLTPLSTGMEGERLVGNELLETVVKVGFFYVKNHGVAQQLIDRVFAVGHAFYSIPVKQ